MGVWIVRVAAGAAAALCVAAAAAGSWGLAVAAALFALVAAFAARPHAADSPAPVCPAPVRSPHSAEPDVVVASLFESMAERVPAVAAHMWLLDHPTATLRHVASAGTRMPSPAPVTTADPVLGAAADAGHAVLQAIASVHEQDGATTLWRFAVPVGAADANGVAAVDVLCADGTPDREALTEVTAALRGALTGALALYVARAEIESARVLLEAARELSSRLRPGDVVRRSLERAMEISHAATGSVMLYDESAGVMRIAEAKGLPASVVDATEVRDGEGIAGWVFASGSSMLVEDLPGRPASRRHGVRSAICVPIADGGRTLGVINVGSRTYPARFTDGHMRALEALGAQTAVALNNAGAVTRSRDLYLVSLKALAVALETKDPYAIGAAGRVSDLVLALGEWMGLDETDLQALHVAAILHDVGMGMAAGPLGSTSRPLRTIDRGLLRAHPRVAAELLSQIPALEAVVPIVYHHHEHFDGHGYDGGIAGEDIPLGSRILAVVDAYVSMTGERPYRRSLTPREALNELNAKSGSQFDPEVVEALTRLFTENPDLALTAR